MKLSFNFKKLGEEDSTNLPTANNADFEIRHILASWKIGHRDLSLGLSFSLCPLVDVSVLVQNKLVEYTGIEDALQHQYISHNFTGHKCVLHFFIRNKIVQPVLSKFRDSTHLEEVWRLHVTTNPVFFLAFRSTHLADLTKATFIFAHSILRSIDNIFMRKLNAICLVIRLGFKSAVRSNFTGLFVDYVHHPLSSFLTLRHWS